MISVEMNARIEAEIARRSGMQTGPLKYGVWRARIDARRQIVGELIRMRVEGLTVYRADVRTETARMRDNPNLPDGRILCINLAAKDQQEAHSEAIRYAKMWRPEADDFRVDRIQARAIDGVSCEPEFTGMPYVYEAEVRYPINPTDPPFLSWRAWAKVHEGEAFERWKAGPPDAEDTAR